MSTDSPEDRASRDPHSDSTAGDAEALPGTTADAEPRTDAEPQTVAHRPDPEPQSTDSDATTAMPDSPTGDSLGDPLATGSGREEPDPWESDPLAADLNAEAEANARQRDESEARTVAAPAPASTGAATPAEEDPDPAEDAALREERARRFGRFGGRTRTEDEPAEQPTTALRADEGAPDREPEQPTRAVRREEPVVVNEDDPFENWDDPPRSRAQAHWWVVLITLVFAAPAWYLITDGGERWSNAREVAPEAIHVGALLEIGGGLLLTIVVLLAARWSSVGPIIVGSITAAIGAAFLAVPQIVEDFLLEYSDIFTRLGQFGQNVYDHLLMDGNTGRLLVYGVVLIMVGVVSHGARRQGRREERRRAAAEAL